MSKYVGSCLGIQSKTKFALLMLFSFSSISSIIFILSYYQQEVRMQDISPFIDYNDVAILQTDRAQQISLRTSNFAISSNNNDVGTHQTDLALSIADQIPVLVFSAKRPRAIRNHLKQLTRLRPSAPHFPIIVSQDGDDQQVAEAIKKFVTSTPHLHHIQFTNHKERSMRGANYYYIAEHYKFALDRIFTGMGFKIAIITEDDLDIADDFFEYFNFTRPLLYSDPSIWCISAWNDNGNPSLVDWENGIERFWRTDFFPGLGWMLRAELWAELRENWPEAYWDDWLRKKEVRKNRVCIRPEISRTLHNLMMAGKGSSNGLYKIFLSSIKLPKKQANFSAMDLNLLKKEHFDAWLWFELRSAKPVTLQQLLANGTANSSNDGAPLLANNDGTAYIVRYQDPREFRQLSQKFHLMADIRAGMARTAYQGVVPFRIGHTQMFALHHRLNLSEPFGRSPSDQIYDKDWDLASKYLDFSDLFCTPKRWTGKCDPYSEPMRAWFHTKGWAKQLEQWGNMTVF